MVIGILGLQGCVEPHQRKFATLGIETRRILHPADLKGLAGLVIPGGESTTMLKTAHDDLLRAIETFGQERAVWGVCAGCILQAKKVTHPDQRSLGMLDIDVRRNAYGSQLNSFIKDVRLALPEAASLRAVFIRAPIVTRVGAGIEVYAEENGHPIILSDGRHLASTFHPELSDSTAIHAHFAKMVQD